MYYLPYSLVRIWQINIIWFYKDHPPASALFYPASMGVNHLSRDNVAWFLNYENNMCYGFARNDNGIGLASYKDKGYKRFRKKLRNGRLSVFALLGLKITYTGRCCKILSIESFGHASANKFGARTG